MPPSINVRDAIGGLTDVVSNAVCTPAQYDAILTRCYKSTKVFVFTKEAPEPNARSEIEWGLLQLACTCYDNGSSDKISIPGGIKFANTGDAGKRDQTQAFNPLIKLVQETCTLRQLCMYLAKYVWYIRVCCQRRAPAGWASRGLPRALRFIAFDFVAGVTHEAAAEVLGLDPDVAWRDPTDQELAAATAAFQLAVYHANSQAAVKASNFLEVTHGKIGTNSARLALPAPPEVD